MTTLRYIPQSTDRLARRPLPAFVSPRVIASVRRRLENATSALDLSARRAGGYTLTSDGVTGLAPRAD